MSFAETDKKILTSLTESLQEWCSVFVKDPINETLGVKALILDNDLPQLRRVRWYAINSQVEAEKLWTRYVEQADQEGEVKDTLFDFYMNGATYIWMKNPISDAHYTSFISHLAGTVSWPSRSKLIPQEVQGYVVSSEQFNELLKNNHWLVFLLLLSVTDIQQ